MNTLLSLLNDWNESINRFVMESLRDLFFQFLASMKEQAIDLFWSVVNVIR